MNARKWGGLAVLILAAVLLGPAICYGGKQNQPAAAGHAAAAQRVVAEVNGQPITLGALLERMKQIGMHGYGRQKMTVELAGQMKQKALNQLIMEELVQRRIRAAGITVTPEEVSAQMARLKSRLGGEKGFRGFLRQKKMTEEDLRRHVQRFLAAQRLIAREVDDTIHVTPEDIAKAYELNKERFTQHEKVEVADVTFFLDPDAKGSVGKAEQVLTRIKTEDAGDPSRLKPDPTFIVRKQVRLDKNIEPNLYAEAKRLQPGALSGVINANGTLHLIKLTGYRPETTKTLDEVSDYLKKELREHRRQKKLEEWKAALMKEAKIKIFDLHPRAEK